MTFLTSHPIDVAALVSEARRADGALCLFLGVVRNESEGRATLAIDYEAYGPMAESELARIVGEIGREWPAARVRVVHRIGRLVVGETSVAVVATAPHRPEAFDACRAAIDRVKRTVPIWKKEIRPDGTSEWVDPTATKTAPV